MRRIDFDGSLDLRKTPPMKTTTTTMSTMKQSLSLEMPDLKGERLFQDDDGQDSELDLSNIQHLPDTLLLDWLDMKN